MLLFVTLLPLIFHMAAAAVQQGGVMSSSLTPSNTNTTTTNNTTTNKSNFQQDGQTETTSTQLPDIPLNMPQCVANTSSSSQNGFHASLDTEQVCSRKCYLQIPREKIIQVNSVCTYAYIIAWHFDKGDTVQPRCLRLWCKYYVSAISADFVSWTGTIVIKCRIRFAGLVANLTFTAADASDNNTRPTGIHVIQRSPQFGSITTPGNMDRYVLSCATVMAPAGHVIFLSSNATKENFYRINLLLFLGQCRQDLDRGRKLEDFPITFPHWLYVSDQRPPNTTVDSNKVTAMSVLFYGNVEVNVDAFHMMFSFHRKRPHKVDGQWNCSLSEWSELYRHFPCDLVSQCAGDEDETHCPLYSERCGLGRFEVEGDCFLYLKKEEEQAGDSRRKEEEEDEETKETGALQLCAEQGASVARFRSFSQLDKVVDFIKRNVRYHDHLQVDLHRSRPFLGERTDIYIQNMYVNTLRWGTGSIAYNVHKTLVDAPRGFYINTDKSLRTYFNSFSVWCNPLKVEEPSSVLCVLPANPTKDKPRENIVMDRREGWTPAASSAVPLVTCRSGHLTLEMLACDAGSLCDWKAARKGNSHTAACRVSAARTVPYFRCKGTEEFVPYGVLCDGYRDCGDDSDEAFCQFPPCQENAFECGTGQCIKTAQQCDGMVNCRSRRDEHFCSSPCHAAMSYTIAKPPALVNMNEYGSYTLTPLPSTMTRCPSSHYLCPSSGYCLPVYTRCNGVSDCTDHEDEADCEAYTCEGFYRCRGKDPTICLHVTHLCDGWPHCPQQEDEAMCGSHQPCPPRCVCYGRSWVHSLVLQADSFPKIRYLEGRGSGLTLEGASSYTMLVHLGAAACGWRTLGDLPLPNLRVLDVSDNLLLYVNVTLFSRFSHLLDLDLSGNPLSSGLVSVGGHHRLDSLLVLNVSRVSHDFAPLRQLSDSVPKVTVLDVSHSKLRSLPHTGLFPHLKYFHIQGCRIADINTVFFKEMTELEELSGDHFKLCCSAVLPGNFLGKCSSPPDGFSSCDNLLKSGFYQAMFIVFALTAVVGNICIVVYYLRSSPSPRTGSAVFIMHLYGSHFFMGVYLLLIGSADQLYAGNYAWKESWWRRSAVCSVSGFLFLLSCEASSILVSLMTLDGFLSIAFPFSRFHFGAVLPHVLCTATWALGVMLASVPFLPVTSHWAFYSQTGICIPLPHSTTDVPGSLTFKSILLVFNTALCLLTASGLVAIWRLTTGSRTPREGRESKTSTSTGGGAGPFDACPAGGVLVLATPGVLSWLSLGLAALLAKLRAVGSAEDLALVVLPFNASVLPVLDLYRRLRARRCLEEGGGLQKLIRSQVKVARRVRN